MSLWDLAVCPHPGPTAQTGMVEPDRAVIPVIHTLYDYDERI